MSFSIRPNELLAIAARIYALGDVELVRAPIPGNLCILRDGEQIGHVDFVMQELAIYADQESEDA